MMVRYYDVFETSLGWVGLLASPVGLRRTTLPQPSPDDCLLMLGLEADKAALSPERFEALKGKMARYYGGEAVAFDSETIDVDDAAPFTRAVWGACRSIRYGETRSYQWLASQAGNARAPRAAGQSMARNRLPIVVPCHRVIASDGGLGGFGGGASALLLKQRLLDLEAGARISFEAV